MSSSLPGYAARPLRPAPAEGGCWISSARQWRPLLSRSGRGCRRLIWFRSVKTVLLVALRGWLLSAVFVHARCHVSTCQWLNDRCLQLRDAGVPYSLTRAFHTQVWQPQASAGLCYTGWANLNETSTPNAKRIFVQFTAPNLQICWAFTHVSGTRGPCTRGPGLCLPHCYPTACGKPGRIASCFLKVLLNPQIPKGQSTVQTWFYFFVHSYCLSIAFSSSYDVSFYFCMGQNAPREVSLSKKNFRDDTSNTGKRHLEQSESISSEN